MTEVQTASPVRKKSSRVSRWKGGGVGQRLAVCGLPPLFLNRQQMVCFRQVAEPGRLFSRQSRCTLSPSCPASASSHAENSAILGEARPRLPPAAGTWPAPHQTGAVCHWRGIQLVPRWPPDPGYHTVQLRQDDLVGSCNKEIPSAPHAGASAPVPSGCRCADC